MTGAITAASSGLDVFGVTMVGTITATGGGTFRDAIFLRKQPFWVEETEYLWIAITTAVATFFAWPIVKEWQSERKRKAIAKQVLEEVPSTPPTLDPIDAGVDVLDAIGIGAFCVIGAQNGEFQQAPNKTNLKHLPPQTQLSTHTLIFSSPSPFQVFALQCPP
jgi:uncharacterized membrane protein YeiH